MAVPPSGPCVPVAWFEISGHEPVGALAVIVIVTAWFGVTVPTVHVTTLTAVIAQVPWVEVAPTLVSESSRSSTTSTLVASAVPPLCTVTV